MSKNTFEIILMTIILIALVVCLGIVIKSNYFPDEDTTNDTSYSTDSEDSESVDVETSDSDENLEGADSTEIVTEDTNEQNSETEETQN